MLLQLSTKGTFETFPPKVTDLPPKERAVYTYLKEDKLKNGLQKEATVLGVSPPHYKGNPKEIHCECL
jgi:hypothetical protein